MSTLTRAARNFLRPRCTPTATRQPPLSPHALATTTAAAAAATTAAIPTMTRPLFQTSVWDPTFLFTLNCLFSVVFLSGAPEPGSAHGGTLSFRPPTEIPFVLFSYILDPAFFAALVVLLALRHFVGDDAKKLTPSEDRRAGWYLWNTVIIHVMMDGMAGTKWGNRLMAENYEMLDFRFQTGAHPCDAALTGTIVNMELFFYPLITGAAYVGIVTRARWRCEIEIASLVMQLYGAVMFVVPEILTNCLNMVPHGVPTCLPEPSFYNLFFYYFGVGVNMVWMVTPVYLLKTAIELSVAQKPKSD